VQQGKGDTLKPALACCQNAARDLPAEELPNFIGQLESIKATAWARLTAPTPVRPEHDALVSVKTAAERLGISRDYLYRHHAQYSFTRRQGRKLLFSALGIERRIRKSSA
jgi:hypothetical protein